MTNRLISQREYFRMNQSKAINITNFKQLERKMRLKGKVIKTNAAGAIVDIGIEKLALLHISQIVYPSDTPIKRASEILKEGQELDLWIYNINKDRIEVTMKEPLALEWQDIKKNMVVRGKVVKIENFGVFVDIGAESPGLIHISELAQGYVKAASEVVSVGDEVEAKIIDFNRRRKQIKLSIKALQPDLDEIDGVTVIPARPKRKSHKPKRKEKNIKPKPEEKTEPDPTTMEIALRNAMEHTKNNEAALEQKKHSKTVSEEQEKILQRTLKQRM